MRRMKCFEFHKLLKVTWIQSIHLNTIVKIFYNLVSNIFLLSSQQNISIPTPYVLQLTCFTGTVTWSGHLVHQARYPLGCPYPISEYLILSLSSASCSSFLAIDLEKKEPDNCSSTWVPATHLVEFWAPSSDLDQPWLLLALQGELTSRWKISVSPCLLFK